MKAQERLQVLPGQNLVVEKKDRSVNTAGRSQYPSKFTKVKADIVREHMGKYRIENNKVDRGVSRRYLVVW
jgi:hypothetical protein